MKPVKTEYSNITFTQEGCGDLPATLCQTSDGIKETETVWELSDKELKQIIKNRRVYVYMYGHFMPPIVLFSESQLIRPDGDGHD